MTTICSSCGRTLKENGDTFIACPHCMTSTPEGANSFNKLKGGNNKMETEKKVNKTLYVKCSVCGEDKFTRPDVYEKRVAKFGSVEEMNAKYVCRDCKKVARDAAAKATAPAEEAAPAEEVPEVAAE